LSGKPYNLEKLMTSGSLNAAIRLGFCSTKKDDSFISEVSLLSIVGYKEHNKGRQAVVSTYILDVTHTNSIGNTSSSCIQPPIPVGLPPLIPQGIPAPMKLPPIPSGIPPPIPIGNLRKLPCTHSYMEAIHERCTSR
jgi:hypothetical protein